MLFFNQSLFDWCSLLVLHYITKEWIIPHYFCLTLIENMQNNFAAIVWQDVSTSLCRISILVHIDFFFLRFSLRPTEVMSLVGDCLCINEETSVLYSCYSNFWEYYFITVIINFVNFVWVCVCVCVLVCMYLIKV